MFVRNLPGMKGGLVDSWKFNSIALQMKWNSTHKILVSTHDSVMSGAKRLYELLQCRHATMVKTCMNQDCFSMNQFAKACSTSNNNISYALSLFNEMPNPNCYVYNAIITGLVKWNHPIPAFRVYLRMSNSGISPSVYTFPPLIKACGLVSDGRLGESVHGHVWKYGLALHLFVQTALVDFYSVLRKKVEFVKVFDEMSERDGHAWTSMISGLVRVGDMDSAWSCFESMPLRNRDVAAWNTLIDGYARTGNVEAAEAMFDRMPDRDVISWTTMINCYCQNKNFGEALRVFGEMMEVGIRPDEVTMSTIISVCAHVGALDIGKKIHHFVMSNGFNLDVYVGSALIDMYAKCGSLDRSLSIFYKLPEKNLFCWNAVIEGLGAHGYAAEALAMFNKMEQEKIQPNGVTFVSVLSACAHAGFVEEGYKRFASMTYDYSIRPEIAHYGCMVDLLSKSGLLTEALELIGSMNLKPNAVIWGALLGGCKLHRNVEIARIAIRELMVLDPDNSGYFNLLINFYAEVDRWDEATKIRTTMRELGVEKISPGSSWIEIGSKVYRFASSDKSHMDSHNICSFLVGISINMKSAAYLSELWSFL